MAPAGWLERRRASGPWQEARYEVLDLETSGLDPARDEILSVAAVPVRDGVIRFGERFASLVRPRDLAALSQEGLRAHHLVPADLAAAPPLDAVLPQLLERLAGAVLVVHRAAMDLPFLAAAARRLQLAWSAPRLVDTVELLARLDRRRSFLHAHPAALPAGLAAARAALGLPEYPGHEAPSDALATAELFLLLRSRLEITKLGQLLA